MLLATLTLLGALGAPAAQATDTMVAIRAKTVHVGGGQTLDNATILIDGGTIRAVGVNLKVPAGTPVIEHDGPASAGLIALHGYAGTKLPMPTRTIRLGPFGHPEGGPHPRRGEVPGPEGWRRHVHGHVEVEDPAEEVVLDRGEEHVEEDHEGHGHDEDEDEDDGHEHGGTGDPEPVEEEPTVAAVEPGLFAAREVVVDTTRTVIPEAESAHAFNPGSADLQRALESGITTLVLAPDPTSLVPGQTAVVKASGRVLERNAHLSLGFRASALKSDRYPTSLSGAVAELDRRFAEPEGPFERAANGQLPVLFEVAGRQDVLRAADFAKRHKLKGAVSGASRAGEVADAIKAAELAAVVGPFPIGANGRSLRSVVELARAGVPFGFGLDAPRYDPELLRLSAASCVGQGLAPEVALSALTDTAARIAGVEKRVGRLAAGLDADVVLWSGDPLDLGSRPQTVIVDGRVVVGGVR